MRPLLFILAVLLSSTLGVSAFNAAFEEAQTAYDQGHYTEAAQHYEGMLSNGVDNIEIHYNLGNAMFKAGDLPNAVLHYRTAWYNAPRDPDINANLLFALNAAGAIEPSPPLSERILCNLSLREWVLVAFGSYLVLATLLLLALLIRGARLALFRLCLIPATLLLVAAGGWWQWRAFRAHPEAVVIKAGTTALYGPVEGATAHYKLPLGALVRQCNTDPKGWIEVEYDRKRGWINADDILSLSP